MDFELLRDGIYQVGSSEWFLVDEPMLLAYTSKLGAELVDPIKTSIVQASRCMTYLGSAQTQHELTVNRPTIRLHDSHQRKHDPVTLVH
ncbi:MAG TPA: hypothetical protein VME23_04805 [Terracidiphilus sp.]|nr:hypothetical protein [Terracidiphilus sp.]